jgi:putative protease
MDRKVELLAPAGDWDSFIAAVENGADAVYLGSKQFNARQFAGNFDAEELKRALDYAHVRDVKIYLALNTLILDSEMETALELAQEAYSSGIDGIIVQDIGFARLLKKVVPGLDLHASTQMTIYNLEGVKILESLGFKRAVLARELSLKEIEYISKNTSVEIEIFIHGALCISYSGQCLMSSIIGGRSGNRGKCAQPCRLPFEVAGGIRENNKQQMKGYFMSPKDLCTVSLLGDIVDTGVRSLKIEGRMKSPEYVATVVGIYRKYLDRLCEGEKINVTGEDNKRLLQIFNRGGFSTGYLKGKSGAGMMCFEKPKNWGVFLGRVVSYDRARKLVGIKLEDYLEVGDGIEVWNGEDESPGTVVSRMECRGKGVSASEKGEVVYVGNIYGRIDKGNKVYKTSSRALNAAAKESFSGKSTRRIGLECKVIIRKDAPLVLLVKDEAGNEVEVHGSITPEKAVNKALTKERIIEQLNKTGDTPFVFSHVDVQIDENLALPISEINNIRRRALEEMENKRTVKKAVALPDNIDEIVRDLLHFPGNSRNMKTQPHISVFFYNWDKRYNPSVLEHADRLYLPFGSFLDPENLKFLEKYREGNCRIFAWIPSVTRGNYDSLVRDKLSMIVEWGIEGILLGNLGSIQMCAGKYPGLKVFGDFQLNVLNSFSLEEMYNMGLDGISLSVELNMSQINSLRDVKGLNKEVIVYGRIPLMTSEYCPVGSVEGGFGPESRCKGSCRKGNYYLKDRKGAKFPVLCDRIDCRSVILNSNIIFVPDSLDRISKAGIDSVRLNVFDESPEKLEKLLEMHRDIISRGQDRIKNYEELVGEVEMEGFTRGHYQRGV